MEDLVKLFSNSETYCEYFLKTTEHGQVRELIRKQKLMLRRKCSQGKCSQGTLTQSKRHIMARVNHLQKHLLSHCSINLCTWWILLALSAAGRELQVTSAFCPRQPADSSSPPAVCAGQHCLCLREEDVFCLPYKHHSDNAESFPHGPLPPVPKFPLLSPSFPRAQNTPATPGHVT